MAGKVYLVGAGPGDARLITVKGWECIQLGDVIVYDRLASPRLLGLMKPGAQKIYVGKLPDRHTMKQEEINQLLVDLALEGKTVVRLKGETPLYLDESARKPGYCVNTVFPMKLYPASHQRSVCPPMRAFQSHTEIWPHRFLSLQVMKVRINSTKVFIGIK